MKIFFSVLAAILVAGVIFICGWGFVATINDWENRKEKTIALLDQTRQVAHQAADDSRGGSIEQLEAGLRVMARAAGQEHELLLTLKHILETKPFLGLNPEEAKTLVPLNEEPSPTATPEKSESVAVSTPVPKPAIPATPPPKFVTITQRTEAKIPETFEMIPLKPGQQLRFVSLAGDQVRVQYGKFEAVVDFYATDLSHPAK